MCIKDGPCCIVSRGVARSVPCLIPHTDRLLRGVDHGFLSSLTIGNVPLRALVIASILHARQSMGQLHEFGFGTSRGDYRHCKAAFSVYCGHFRAIDRPSKPRHAPTHDSCLG